MAIAIYITGDIYGSISCGERFEEMNFMKSKYITKDNYVIVVGDFGLL